MKAKLFVALEIQYFELKILKSFISYVCYVARAFSLLTRGFELVTRNSCITFSLNI